MLTSFSIREFCLDFAILATTFYPALFILDRLLFVIFDSLCKEQSDLSNKIRASKIIHILKVYQDCAQHQLN